MLSLSRALPHHHIAGHPRRRLPYTLMEAIRWLHDKDRVLLVDDEVALTNLWRDVLESTGRYIVQEENSAERAIQAAQEFRPHLIFMD